MDQLAAPIPPPPPPVFKKRFHALNKNDLILLAQTLGIPHGGLVSELKPRIRAHLDTHKDTYANDERFAALYLVGRVPANAPQEPPPNPTPSPPPQIPPPQIPPIQPPIGEQQGPEPNVPEPLNANPQPPPPADAAAPPLPLIPTVDDLSRSVADRFAEADGRTRLNYLSGLRELNMRFFSDQGQPAAAHTVGAAAAHTPAQRGVRGLLQGGVFLDPPAVITKLRRGWQDHIPLNLLTDSACATAGQSIPSHDSLRIRDGQIHIAATTLDHSCEHEMTAQDLLQAYPRLIRMIRLYYSGEHPDHLADDFQAHFSLLQARPEFWSQTRFIVVFDIHLRKRFLQEPFDLRIWQSEVWQTMLEENIFSLANAAQNSWPQFSTTAFSTRDYRSPFPESLPSTSPTTGVILSSDQRVKF
ncbi:hypothetical protein BD410DRAFT_899981 [Rickenella mellea]|uniref:SAP domain-containing protein n=1 Tax=Rickenella mellea TaxID=50990 RepID=A0A4Y7PZ85_9AGAM|nr:hypothetical protein BD410DRAFT_899981 [Rickenella mellea]